MNISASKQLDKWLEDIQSSLHDGNEMDNHIEGDAILLGIAQFYADTLPPEQQAKVVAIIDGFQKMRKWYS